MRNLSKALLVTLAGGLLAIGAAALMPRCRTAFGQGGILDDFIIFLRASSQVESLRAVLTATESAGRIDDLISRSAIWHIETIPDKDEMGFRHVLFFAGRNRTTTRLYGLIVDTRLVADGYHVVGLDHEFNYLTLGGRPMVRDATGLDVLRAALEEQELTSDVTSYLASVSVNLRTMSVDPAGDRRFQLTFQPRPGNEQPPPPVWTAAWDSTSSRYAFRKE